jgi:hypothetical protein
MLRRRRSWVTRAAAAVVAAVCAIGAAVPVAADAADDPVRIWTDATGPLFSATNLAPGDARTACLAISYQGRDDASLRMAASTSGGSLGSFLDLTIAVGVGGRYGDCSAFTGSQVYSGTLADFAARYADPSAGLALDGGASAPTGTVSIRVTVRMRDDDRAQGQVLESSFVWYAVGPFGESTPDDEPPDVEVPVTGPLPTAPPPSTGPTPATPAPVSPTPTPKPTASSSRSGVASPTQAGGPPSGSAAAQDRRRSIFERVVDSVYDSVKEAAPAVFKGARIPLYLLPLVLLFLLIQNEIDRRDPKLALAPAYADPDLPFDYDPTPAKA